MKKTKELFIITGGTKGIGKSIVSAVYEEGEFEVVIVARSVDNADKEIFPDVKFFFDGDLSTQEGLNKVSNEILNLDMPINTLVNNAGNIYDTNPLSNIDLQTLLYSMQLHCYTPLILANNLKSKLDLSDYPSIINVGSIYGNIGDIEVPAYVLSKSTLPILTTMMAKSYAPKIRVNCILPGHVDTDMTQSAPKEFINQVIEKTAVKRLSTPKEIAQTVMYLCSKKSSFINGASIRVDGGFWSTAP